MLPADSASRAGSTPEASGDWSSGTFGTKNMRTPWKAIYLELPTSDIAAAIHYFETHLGFTTDFHLIEIGYGKITRDDQSIFLSRVDGPFEPRSCMIYTEDIQAAYKEMKDAGVEICREIEALSVGATEFSVRVSDGHIFTIFH